MLIKVLLVEDDLGDALWIQEILEASEGSLFKFEVHHCARLGEARQYLTGEKPDVVLLDLGLPDSQGMPTLERLIEVAPDLPVVVFTGYADGEFGVTAVQKGAQDYLIKGQFNQDQLLRTLRFALERQRAEAALIQAKQEWERTFDAVSDYIAILDNEHRIIRMNRAMAELLGKNQAEVIGRPCYKVVHGLDEPPDFCPHSRVIATGQESSAEVEEFGRIFAVSVAPIFGPDGQFIGGVHVARDITERKLAEEALRESEERYRSLFEKNHAVMLLMDPENGRIEDANPSACLYYGYTREELLTQKITDINVLAPEEVVPKMQGALSEQRKHFEFRHRLASGEVRDVEVFSGPIRIKGRELLYSIVHDNTARKQAEEALKRHHAILDGIGRVFREALTCETEEQLGETCLAEATELTDSMFGFIGELNREGNLDVIAISFLGWEACKIPGTNKLVTPKGFKVHGIYGTCIREGKSAIANDPATHPDRVGLPEGHPPITSFLGVPLEHGGKTIGMIGLGNKAGGYTEADREAVETLAPAVVEALMRKRAELAVRQARDKLEQRVAERTVDLRHTVDQLQWEIRERQRVEEELRQSEDRLRFLASQLLTAQETERKRLAWELHDDLGQSLMILKMQLRAVERKLPPEFLFAKGELDHSLDYINEVVENVRRMSHDLQPSVLEGLGLNVALKHLLEEFSRRKDIQYSLDMEDIQGLLSDEAQIAVYRIFQESLTNIAKHAQATHIKATIKPRDGKAFFQVEDNGSGFEPREVLSGNCSKRGLGLTAMDERVRLLGGELHIFSKPGAGTKISFNMPTNSKN